MAFGPLRTVALAASAGSLSARNEVDLRVGEVREEVLVAVQDVPADGGTTWSEYLTRHSRASAAARGAGGLGPARPT
jgi:hypothetical protein